MIKAIDVKRGWFRDSVLFEADSYHECSFGSLFGTRVFWMNDGDRVRLKMPKGQNWIVGDKVKHLSRLVNMDNQDKFSWNYADMLI